MPKGYKVDYTTEQLEFLKTHSTLMRHEMTELFNKKFGTKFQKATLSALCKRNGWLTGRSGHLCKGHVPKNKGTKGVLTANRTSFKKGQMPHNHKPLGYERINVCGYIEVKIAEPRTFRHKHVLVWEQHHGSIPKDKCIIFKDANKLNVSIENLEMVSRAELLKINQMRYAEQPIEIKPTVLLLARLSTKAFEVCRQQKGLGVINAQ